MEDPVADAILNQYFRRLEQALSGLAAERRAQIVEDLRTHVEECLQAESDHSDRSRVFCSAATAPRRHLSKPSLIQGRHLRAPKCRRGRRGSYAGDVVVAPSRGVEST